LSERQEKLRPEVSLADTGRLFTILERILFLKGVDLFKNVDTERLSVIAEIAREIVVESGEVVSREGETGESLYIIKEGGLRITKEKEGKQYSLKNLVEGECFGVFSIFNERPRTSGALANERTLLLEIRKNEFKKVLIANPEIAYNILEILSERISEMDNEIVLLNKALNENIAKAL
jgi:CRP-like cAMP-binding protein